MFTHLFLYISCIANYRVVLFPLDLAIFYPCKCPTCKRGENNHSMNSTTRRNALDMSARKTEPPVPGAPGKTEILDQGPPPVSLTKNPPFPFTSSPSSQNTPAYPQNSGKVVTVAPATTRSAPPSPAAAGVVLPASPRAPKPYKSEYAQMMIDYFSRAEKFRETFDTITWKNGEVKEIARQIPAAPPMFSTFARKIGVSVKQLKAWAKKFPEFLDACEQCQDIFKEFLIENGLLGHYPSQMTIFVAKNETDMKDKSTTDHRVWDMKAVLDAIARGEDPDQIGSGEEHDD